MPFELTETKCSSVLQEGEIYVMIAAMQNNSSHEGGSRGNGDPYIPEGACCALGSLAISPILQYEIAT